ncbi:(d)CMP kinase [Pseudomonas neustonica]|uniref:Cytidylate kinase n=1 Tax=Pseudomonas neustonica TaxID=2487346 RepID=A0ABX9XLH1_9PSED|nr:MULTISPECIES: (d)CMP kinase [Pseudomonas]ROZ82479.1 (d)CMP kinase [Pseudomonas sp. SSM44]ROZ84274.1 (d)CMP kinase [Pseudomonas neustonica]
MTEQAIPVITIDGPGGSGKGTIAGLLASRLGWNLLDSGALYRVLAFAAVNHGVSLTNAESLEMLAGHLDVQFVAVEDAREQHIILEGEEVTRALRTEIVGAGASQVAAIPGVRAALLQRQRAFREAPGLVADGRDMGTVVFADAELKIYLTAGAEERAGRRHRQLLEKGETANLASLLDEIVARDDRDMNRSIAPLRPADDAIQIDSTQMSIEEVLEMVHQEAQKRDLLG